jgi:hypothetical protein
MKTARIIITRFNVRFGKDTNPCINSTEWLRHRLALFGDFTFPSVARQTIMPDKWFVFFDSGTPAAIRRELETLQSKMSLFFPVFCDVFDINVCRNAVEEWLPATVQWIVSTRLDNDDAMNNRLLESVYSTCSDGRREFINPLNGIIITDSRAYRKKDPSSPFISLSEPRIDFSTVFIGSHDRLKKFGLVCQVQIKDAWIQVIHGGNIANRLRGVRARYSSLDLDSFPEKVRLSLRSESNMEFLIDNSFGAVERYTRSALRYAKTLSS